MSNIYMSDLAKELGVTGVTIKYYTEIGLLPFTLNDKDNSKSRRVYDLEKCRAIVDDIKQKKDNGLSMNDIVLDYAKQGKLNDKIGVNAVSLLKTLGGK